jgi:hypothetical protein
MQKFSTPERALIAICGIALLKRNEFTLNRFGISKSGVF